MGDVLGMPIFGGRMAHFPKKKKNETWVELEKMPTLAVGQADDLKVDTGKERIWLSRITGEISIERLTKGRWELVQRG